MSIRTEQFPTDEPAPQTPPDVSWLREARARSGVTLDEISRTTKIRPAYLSALEAGDVDKLPPTFFTRGFIAAYAKVIGIDPQQAADRYCEQVGCIGPSNDEDVAAIIATAVGRTGVTGFDAHHAPLIRSLHPDRSSRLVVAAGLVGALIYIAPSSWGGWVSKVAAATAPAPAAVPMPAPIATTPAPRPAPVQPMAIDTPAASVTEAAGGALQFEIKPQGECWFSATADGNDSQSALLKAGDARSIEAHDALVLRVGDPGACAFSINGHAGRPLGAAGVPVTVRITKDNVKEFVAS